MEYFLLIQDIESGELSKEYFNGDVNNARHNILKGQDLIAIIPETSESLIFWEKDSLKE